jgi:hypothetical protein
MGEEWEDGGEEEDDDEDWDEEGVEESTGQEDAVASVLVEGREETGGLDWGVEGVVAVLENDVGDDDSDDDSDDDAEAEGDAVEGDGVPVDDSLSEAVEEVSVEMELDSVVEDEGQVSDVDGVATLLGGDDDDNDDDDAEAGRDVVEESPLDTVPLVHGVSPEVLEDVGVTEADLVEENDMVSVLLQVRVEERRLVVVVVVRRLDEVLLEPKEDSV